MDDPKGAHGGVAATWVMALLLAFSQSTEAGLLLSIGYAGQWVKSAKKVPTLITQLGLVALCVTVYAALHRPETMPPSEAWRVSAAMWALAALGTGTLAASTRGAAKTDSM